jgi:hypothetical protein
MGTTKRDSTRRRKEEQKIKNESRSLVTQIPTYTRYDQHMAIGYTEKKWTKS